MSPAEQHLDREPSSAECKLLAGAATGTLTDLRANKTTVSNPARGNRWGTGRQIRASLLAELLTGMRHPDGNPPRAIKLRAARVTGALNLEAATLICPLLLQDCYIEEPVNLDEATTRAIRMLDCHLRGLTAVQLRTTGDLWLRCITFTAKSEVSLLGARIGGKLFMSGTRLTNPGGRALYADGLSVEEDMFCREGFTARGEVRLVSAHIGGSLALNGANLRNENGPALTADGLTVGQDLSCEGGFTARGEVRLPGARIEGQLDLDGANLENENGSALSADGLTVGQDMVCREGFTARGEVTLLGARIGGQLDLDGANLENENGSALSADGLTVGQDMFCGEGFTARGEVRLTGGRIGGQLAFGGANLGNKNGPALNAGALIVEQSLLAQKGFTARGEVNLHGARIGGQLNFNGADLRNENGPALNADRLTVERDVLCRDGFTARGEVRLPGARIGAHLDLDGANLENENGRALNAERLTVGQSMFCRQRFTARGAVVLLSAHIGGQLDLSGVSLENENGPALNAYRLTVDQDMHCRDIFVTGEIDLRRARIRGRLDLTGATLANSRGLALDLEAAEAAELRLLPRQAPDSGVDLSDARIGTLRDDPATWPAEFHLQGFTYDKFGSEEVGVRQRLQWLARHKGGYVPQVYDQLASTYGRAGDEKATRKVAVAKQRRRRRAYSPLSWLWYLTVGYGYRPWLAGAWVIALTALGTVVFSRAYPAHMIAIRDHPPAFHAIGYSLDLLLPVIGLGQKSAWQPQGSALQYWSWTFNAAGWVLTTAVIAGLTGIIKRD